MVQYGPYPINVLFYKYHKRYIHVKLKKHAFICYYKNKNLLKCEMYSQEMIKRNKQDAKRRKYIDKRKKENQ